MYTDIEDTEFVESFKTAVERVWRLQDGEDDFGVALSITRVAPARLYGERAACGDETRIGCREPGKGDKIDLHQHLALFPKDGAVLTTGAISTHVTGSTIVLGAHDIAPHVLAHEFGHVLGFPDAYFRGYRDLGADGYLVMEVLADPDDIMSAPGTGVVRRTHFAMVIADAAARSRRPDGGSTSPSAE